MTCQEIQTSLMAYLDGELDVSHHLGVEQHLKACPRCSRLHQEQQALRSALVAHAPRFKAPDALQARIRQTLRGAAQAAAPSETHAGDLLPLRAWLKFLVAAAAVALAFLAAVPWLSGPSSQDRLAGEVVSAHVRSLMADHLTDVPSSNQHTVKPWFNGKLSFAPPVVDLAPQGFVLLGGRLDYFGAHPVAAVVYQRRQHPINLFIWPTERGGYSAEKSLTRQGYHLLHWTEQGFEYWVISDVSQQDLQEFAQVLRHQG